jgi:hypothetical protein
VYSFDDSKFVVFFVGFILLPYVDTHIMIMSIGRVVANLFVRRMG